MMNKLYKTSILILFAGLAWFPHLSFGQGEKKQALLPKRISTHTAHLGKVQPVYMVAGMATLIEVPEAVTGIRLGNPKSVEYFRPDQPENEVTLILKSAKAKPTNLIIRAGKKKYVFDIIPSTSIHQDLLEITGSTGNPEWTESEPRVLLDSSEVKKPEQLHE